ncbi:alginate biosynthesis protein AlgK [Pseudomonas peli]|uniref:alginate biosynthesis protein AlgK n=1 Tax=Pseudomonas peli TaxID=592361 RepID=UPI003D323458
MKRAALTGPLLGPLIGLSLLTGCAGSLPDLDLAKQAKAGGDLSAAEANFRPLAELGYVEAQIGLADVLIRSASAQQQAQGEALYRQALGQSPLAAPRLGKWLASKTPNSPEERAEATRLLRQAMADGDNSALLPWVRVQLQDPQQLKDPALEAQLTQWQNQGIGEAQLGKIQLYRARGDYNQHLEEIQATCERWLAQVSECYVELASIYQIQGNQDKQQALLERLQSDYQRALLPPERIQAVAKVLADSSLGQPAPKSAESLYLSITEVYPDAWHSLGELLVRNPELGDEQALRAYLQQGVDAGSTRAGLLLGQLLIKGRELPADPQAAERYLLQAAVDQPKAHLTLGKLYASGQLGEIDPQKSLEHLLLAARRGDVTADLALAQLFADGRGVKINRVYAYSFALLAQQHGLAYGQVLVERLASQLQPAEKTQAQVLLARELEARGAQPFSLSHAAVSRQKSL